MTRLSPAAKAVFYAFNSKFDWVEDGEPGPQFNSIAAALRAAVDQAIPVTKTPWESTLIPVLSSQEIRDRLLAIADELEKANV